VTWSDRYHFIEAWRAAANDLGIEVTAPFSIRDHGGDELEFIAHIRDFGSRRGTLVWMMPEPLPAARLPHGVFYFISALNPDVFSEYDRHRFVEALEGWGWAARGEPPEWYRGP
jgi:hypothetical protein